MQIEVGDVVQLTGPTMLLLQQQLPKIYNRIVETGAVVARVAAIHQDQIQLQLQALEKPLLLRVHGNLHLLLQLLQKNAGGQVGSYEALTPQAPNFASGKLLFPIASSPSVNSVLDDPGFADDETDDEDDDIFDRVRLSQWVIQQFLYLKQYAIIQDLNREPDSPGLRPDPTDTSENWKFHNKEFRPVKYELSVVEEQAYSAALLAIRDYIQPRPTTVDPSLSGVFVDGTTPSDIDPVE